MPRRVSSRTPHSPFGLDKHTKRRQLLIPIAPQAIPSPAGAMRNCKPRRADSASARAPALADWQGPAGNHLPVRAQPRYADAIAFFLSTSMLRRLAQRTRTSRASSVMTRCSPARAHDDRRPTDSMFFPTISTEPVFSAANRRTFTSPVLRRYRWCPTVPPVRADRLIRQIGAGLTTTWESRSSALGRAMMGAPRAAVFWCSRFLERASSRSQDGVAGRIPGTIAVASAQSGTSTRVKPPICEPFCRKFAPRTGGRAPARGSAPRARGPARPPASYPWRPYNPRRAPSKR